eukprot:maker-scaffold966_size75752-snap-gene-0.18 protein:Tk02194 transcript:maker-scaffold966_size75752-snap-gene-0.18-mRNA-1 annotation:"AGAP008907-PA"
MRLHMGYRALARGRHFSGLGPPRPARIDANVAVESRRFQFIQESLVPTDKFQRSLPRLPIPKLEETCQRYLNSLRPLQDSDAFRTSEKLVQEFLAGPGRELDQALRADNQAHKSDSYINGPWTDMYLRDRRPVSFFHNPGIMFAHDSRAEYLDPAVRCASMLISTLRFFKSYRELILKPEVFHLNPAKSNNDTYWNRVKFMPGLIAAPLSYLFKVFPLDMSQYGNLLQSTRIPKEERDEIRQFPDSRHIVVLKQGHFYAFDVLDSDGQILPPLYYLRSIRDIMGRQPKAASSGIGVFTTESRDVWSAMRTHLVEELGNGEALAKVDSALHIICLDDWEHDESQPSPSVREIVGGSDPGNRWFDKSFSLIYSKNGTVSINFEHAWGDGVAVMRLIDEIVRDSQDNSFFSGADSRQCVPELQINEIQFHVDDKIKSQVEVARKKYFQTYESVDIDGFYYHGMGKEDCKRLGVAPDSLMQTAFQIAYHRLFGKFVPTYESCSTAIFRHGRTETVRPGTNQTKLCAEAFNAAQKLDSSALLKMLQDCSTVHVDMTKNAAQGKGWDRHLFALKNICTREKRPLPSLFEDQSYVQMNQNILSTSTLASHNMIHGGFCPVVPNGFGLGYQIRGDLLGTYVSSFKDHMNASQMSEALVSTFDDLAKVMKSSSSFG